MLKGLKRGVIVLCAVSFIIFLFVPAVSADTSYSIDTSSIGMGARPMALGGAYTAIADDASSVFTNPAGLGLQDKISFVSMSTQLLESVDYQVAGLTYPTQFGTFGVGYIGVNAPGGTQTYYDGSGITVEGGAMNYFDNTITLSYGNDISNFINKISPIGDMKAGAGINLKLLSQGVSGYSGAPSASGYSLDLGTLIEVNNKLSVGVTYQNIASSLNWSTGLNEVLPNTLKIGTAYKAFDNVTLALDANFAADSQATLNGGLEWQATPMFALRGGFSQEDQSIDESTTAVMTDYSVGVGIAYQNFSFDYTYKMNDQFSDLSTNYFSICYSGDEPKKTEKAVINTVTADTTVETPSQPEKADNENNKNAVDKKLGMSKQNNDSGINVLSQYEMLMESAHKTQNVAGNNSDN